MPDRTSAAVRVTWFVLSLASRIGVMRGAIPGGVAERRRDIRRRLQLGSANDAVGHAPMIFSPAARNEC
jgi:hypothetical protein